MTNDNAAPGPTSARRLRRSGASRRGFTLVEAGLAMLIMSLLLLGTVDMFIAACRNTGATSAQVQTTLDASGALQYITSSAREAMYVALPTDTGTPPTGIPAWQAPSGAATDYECTDANGQTKATGIQLTFPNNTNGADPNTTANVLGVNGQPLSPAPRVYDRTVSAPALGQTVWIYRANADGTPNPSSGKYLHVRTNTGGTLTDRTVARSLLTTRADAVTFWCVGRTHTDGTTDYGSTALTAEVLSGAYDPIHNPGTDESLNGQLIPLSGKCVLMRNHGRT